MIVDAITHVTPDGCWFHTPHDAGIVRLLREMDAAEVSQAAVVALADFIPNDFVVELCRSYGDRLLPIVSFNPARHPTAAAAVTAFREELADVPFVGLKLHPRLHRYDPLDPRCLAILEELSSWSGRRRVWLDTLLYHAATLLSKPLVDTLHEIVSRFSRLRFVLLHGGGSFLLQLSDAVRDCPNALIDISFTLSRYRGSSVEQDMRFLLRTFDRRCVFGSDFPEYGPTDALADFDRIAENLDAERRENILGRNFAQWLTSD